MAIFVLLAVVLILGFVFGNWMNFKFRLIGGDSPFHFQAAEQIKENKFRLYSQIETFAIKNPPDYPPFFQYVLALFPKGKTEKYAKYVSPALDCVNKLLLFYTTYLIAGDYWISLLAVISYSVIPIVIQDQVEASPKTMASLFLNATMVSFYMFTKTGNYVYAFSVVLFAMLSLLTHRFSTQTMVMLSFCFLFTGQFALMFLVLSGMLLSVFATKGYSLRLIKSHIRQLDFWRKMNKIWVRRNTANISKILVYLYDLFFTNPFDLFVILAVILFNLKGFGFIVLWIVFVRLISLAITSIHQLKFIGEGYRYLSHNSFPSAMLGAVLVLKYGVMKEVYVLALIAGIAASLAWQITCSKQKTVSLSNDLVRAIEKLRKLEVGKLLVLPYTFGKAVAYYSKKKVFFTVSPFYFDYIKNIYWELDTIENICKKNGIENIFVMNEKAKKYNLNFAKKIYDDGIFTLYKVP